MRNAASSGRRYIQQNEPHVLILENKDPISQSRLKRHRHKFSEQHGQVLTFARHKARPPVFSSVHQPSPPLSPEHNCRLIPSQGDVYKCCRTRDADAS